MKIPSHRGFTLIELMATVAIIGLLLSVALPSYSRYVIRGNRASAQQHLLELAQREQQFLADVRSYKNNVSDLNITTPAPVSKYYTISIVTTDGPPPTFKITAKPLAGTKQVDDGDISIDQAGAKLPADKW